MKTKGHPVGENFVRAANSTKEVLKELEAVETDPTVIHHRRTLKTIKHRIEICIADLESLSHIAATTAKGETI